MLDHSYGILTALVPAEFILWVKGKLLEPFFPELEKFKA